MNGGPNERAQLAGEVRTVADEYLRLFPERQVHVWLRENGSWADVYSSTGDAAGREPPPRHALVTTPTGRELALDVGEGGPALGFFARTLELILAYEEEARLAARELAERYEEINLLYTISEILGSVVNLPDAATKILTEVADTLGGRRASIWVLDAESDRLRRAASVGEEGAPPYIAVDDPVSVTARVFREREAMNVERGTEVPRREERGSKEHDEAFLSVPITYTPPEGESRTIGVITLVGRRHHERFSAGDARMLAAVASQIGAALETQRLMQENVRQQRFARELELAHDLQMKLLPPTDEASGRLRISARCAPADSVGGDFYHLIRLGEARTAVVIGDVSSHGFAAALIMALSMSAIGIYARETDQPAEVLRHLHHALMTELESTEMYMTLWYGVIDADEGTVTYANAGHPHAFLLRADGTRERMAATNPPLGLIPLPEYGVGRLEWDPADDIVVLYTDGLSGAFAPRGKTDGEQALLDHIHELRDRPGEEIVAQVFAEADRTRNQVPADDRTALIIRG